MRYKIIKAIAIGAAAGVAAYFIKKKFSESRKIPESGQWTDEDFDYAAAVSNMTYLSAEQLSGAIAVPESKIKDIDSKDYADILFTVDNAVITGKGGIAFFEKPDGTIDSFVAIIAYDTEEDATEMYHKLVQYRQMNGISLIKHSTNYDNSVCNMALYIDDNEEVLIGMKGNMVSYLINTSRKKNTGCVKTFFDCLA